jgi:hypothetical protein
MFGFHRVVEVADDPVRDMTDVLTARGPQLEDPP